MIINDFLQNTFLSLFSTFGNIFFRYHKELFFRNGGIRNFQAAFVFQQKFYIDKTLCTKSNHGVCERQFHKSLIIRIGKRTDRSPGLILIFQKLDFHILFFYQKICHGFFHGNGNGPVFIGTNLVHCFTGINQIGILDSHFRIILRIKHLIGQGFKTKVFKSIRMIYHYAGGTGIIIMNQMRIGVLQTVRIGKHFIVCKFNHFTLNITFQGIRIFVMSFVELAGEITHNASHFRQIFFAQLTVRLGRCIRRSVFHFINSIYQISNCHMGTFSNIIIHIPGICTGAYGFIAKGNSLINVIGRQGPLFYFVRNNMLCIEIRYY